MNLKHTLVNSIWRKYTSLELIERIITSFIYKSSVKKHQKEYIGTAIRYKLMSSKTKQRQTFFGRKKLYCNFVFRIKKEEIV